VVALRCYGVSRLVLAHTDGGYCARVDLGTTTWLQAVPAFLVAAALLFVPGCVVVRLVGLRGWAVLGVGPAVGTTLLVAAGIVCGAVGVPWGLLPLVLSVLAGWATAAVVGLLVRRWASGPVEPPVPRGLGLLVGAGSLAFTVAAVVVVLAHSATTPDHFPQHPDTIFHLGDALWMTQQRDVSVLHAFTFIRPGGTSVYPAAFHVVTATTSMLSGVDVVASTQAAVLVMSGLVWPAGVVLLGRALLGARLGVVASAAVASVLFTAFPYALMGFGVLWPNLFGQALLPGVVATALAALARVLPHRAPVAAAVPAALVTLAALPGLTTAHPNALVTFLVLGYLVVVAALVRAAWENRGRRARALGQLAAALVLSVGVAGASLAVRTSSMYATGALGPEKATKAAIYDTVFFGPRHAPQLYLLTVVVVIGGLWLWFRHRGAGWVPVAGAGFAALYLLNVTVDDHAVRYLTWPWYNNAIRLAVAGSLPAVLCAAAGFVALGTLSSRLVGRARRSRGALPAPVSGAGDVSGPGAGSDRGGLAARRGRMGLLGTIQLAATLVVLAAFVLGTRGYVAAHRTFLDPYYHPDVAHSWASDQELKSLRALATHIPAGAVTAANAWNGGTYLYVVSGKPLLVPTEKALSAGDRTLLAARLDQAGSSPEVCAAARRQHVEYAIVGGQPFAWAGAKRVAKYRGIDNVGSSPAFTEVARSAPYTLYRLSSCAGT
jgi:hypothetical protein